MQIEKKKHDERDDSLISEFTKNEQSWLLESYQMRIEAAENLCLELKRKVAFEKYSWLTKYIAKRCLSLLGGVESNRLTRYLQRTPEEQVTLLSLSELEHQQLKQLIAARDFKRNLATYKNGLNATVFGKIPDVCYPVKSNAKDPNSPGEVISYELPFTAFKNILGRWNLLILIKEYNEYKPSEGASALQHRQYAQRRLETFIQSKKDFFQNHDWNEYYFHGETVPEDQTQSKFKKSRREVVAQVWDALLEQFTQYVQPDLNAVKFAEIEARKKREKVPAKLNIKVELKEVRKLLVDLGMGTTYHAPGEWAAALRALWLEKIIMGKPSQVANWAVTQEYIEEKSTQVVRKAWNGDGKNEAVDFSTANERRVFEAVCSEARKMLTTKQL